MKVHETSQIRNVVSMGHGGAGKTTLAEACAFVGGATKKMGGVPQSTTLSGYDEEEQHHGLSISIALIPIEYADQSAEPVKINFLDTPGYFDFVGEVEEAIAAADAAMIVVNCKAGLEPGTIKAWEFCEKLRLPRIFLMTSMDDDKASYRELLLKLEPRFGKRAAPLHLPIRENEKFVGSVNVVETKDRRFTEYSAVYTDSDIPDYSEYNLEIAREVLLEAVAEPSEAFVERYFPDGSLTKEEIYTTLREQVATGDIVSIMVGSGVNAQGANALMNAITRYSPSPERTIRDNGVDLTTGKYLVVNYKPDVNLSMKVFRTIADPFIGGYSPVKVLTDVLRLDSELFNTGKEVEEKSGKIYMLRDKEAIEVTELRPGGIGAMAKLSETETGDTLTKKQAPILCNPPQISKPYTYKAYVAKNKGDEDHITSSLTKFTGEDRTLRTEVNTENHQSLLYSIGDQQLEIVVSKLASRYKAEIVLEKPRFTFRETTRKKVEAAGRCKKRSDGHGQFGDVKMSFEPPGDLEKAYVFEEQVFGGVVPKNYFPAVEKGTAECCKRDPLAAYPVVGLKVMLPDGSYHPVDSSELAFKMAASIAFKKGFLEAVPVLLESIVVLTVHVPDANTGGVMGDLNRRRGRVLGMESDHHGRQLIHVDIPASEFYGYDADLRSLSGGLGGFAYELSRYEQCPGDVQKREVEARISPLRGEEE